MTQYYTGIGSRETPFHILELMTKIAIYLDSLGFILRSGGASGADTAKNKIPVYNLGNNDVYLKFNNFIHGIKNGKYIIK